MPAPELLPSRGEGAVDSQASFVASRGGIRSVLCGATTATNESRSSSVRRVAVSRTGAGRAASLNSMTSPCDATAPPNVSRDDSAEGCVKTPVSDGACAGRAANLRAVLAGEYQTERGRCRSQGEAQRDQASLLAGLPFAPNEAVSGDRE